MSDQQQDEPVERTPVESIEDGVGVGAEYADPEPDEALADSGGDLVQLVRTGWVRFVIAGHGRVRLRPPRFGELRTIMQTYEQMVDEVQERSHQTQAIAEGLNAEIMAANEPVEGKPEPTPEERHALLASVTNRSNQAGRGLTRWREDQYLEFWRFVHAGDGDRFGGLGVSGEELPDVDGMPVWLTVPALTASVLRHWQAVPLDPGRR